MNAFVVIFSEAVLIFISPYNSTVFLNFFLTLFLQMITTIPTLILKRQSVSDLLRALFNRVAHTICII